MLVTPSLRQFENNSSIDGNLENTFNFDVVGGDLVVKNRLFIQNISTNETIYDEVQTTYSLRHVIPSGNIINGNTYKARLKTYNQQGEESNWSEWIIFSAYSTANLEFTNLGNGNITSPSYIFTATYSQAQDVGIRSFRFLLYDNNKTLISESSSIISEDISYQLDSMENGENYYVEFRITTDSNAVVSTGLKQIYVSYVASTGGEVLEVKNNPEKACVDLNVMVRDVRFGIKEGEISYVYGESIDLYNGVIYTDEELGFSLAENKWTLQMKFTLNEDTVGEILRLIDNNGGYLTLEKGEDKIFIRFYMNNEIFLNSWVRVGEIITGDEVTIMVQKDGIGFDKHCEVKKFDRISLRNNEDRDVLTKESEQILITRKD